MLPCLQSRPMNETQTIKRWFNRHLGFELAALLIALIVMVNLPLALVGGVAGVYLAGGVLSLASIVGFITLFGIATRNGIMLISHIRDLRSRGVEFRNAVMEGASERLAPILMTALAAGLALVPIAMGMGKPGSEIQISEQRGYTDVTEVPPRCTILASCERPLSPDRYMCATSCGPTNAQH